MFDPYTRYCAKLRKQSLLRRLPQIAPRIDFSTNDYLGFSHHPDIIQAAQEAAAKYGVGSKASRLVSTPPLVSALEADIATCKKAPSALVLATGFQANSSILSALFDKKALGSKVLVFADKLNHASMNAACLEPHIKLYRYQHLDYDHLQHFLNHTRSLSYPKFILTESIFGMDGDRADLSFLIKLAKDHQAFLYVDEAHATGLWGEKGYGLTGDFPGEVDLSMGTFSKALGGSGAYIACNKILKRYLLNRCQGFIYSTAPSPMQIAAMHKAWELVPSVQPQVKELLIKSEKLRQQLRAMKYEIPTGNTNIIPLIVKDPKTTLVIQRELAEEGIKVAAIRPPTVPVDQSRIRIALRLDHSLEEMMTLTRLAGLNDLSQRER